MLSDAYRRLLSSYGTYTDMELRTVLVVEDCPDARELFCEALEMENLKPVPFPDGGTALQYLQNAEPLPDMILVDLSMPLMGGEEFIQHVKKDPRLSGVKVIVSSGWDDLKLRARDLGVDGYLRKPFELTELHRQVERCLMAASESPVNGTAH